MIVYGNKLADSLNLPEILSASPVGYPLYAANQFDALSSLAIYLTDWAPE